MTDETTTTAATIGTPDWEKALADVAPNLIAKPPARKDQPPEYYPNEANIGLLLRYMPELRDYYAHDRFTQTTVVSRDRIEHTSGAKDIERDMTTEDATKLTQHLQRYYKMPMVSQGAVTRALNARVSDVAVDSLREWVDALKWDKVKRLDNWIRDYAGGADTPLNRIYSRKFLLGMIARGVGVDETNRFGTQGVQADEMLVLISGEGYRKSSMLRALVGTRWFMEGCRNIKSVEAVRALAGKWLVEFAEMTAFEGANHHVANDFISRTTDTVRRLYTDKPIDVPRRCRFVATTNTFDPVDNPDAARRFWVVELVKPCEPEKLAEVREQLFAEAAHAYYDLAESWHLTPDEERLSRAHTEGFKPDVEWHSDVLATARLHAKDALPISSFMPGDLKLKYANLRGTNDAFTTQNVGAYLRSLGWERSRVGRDKRRLWTAPASFRDGLVL